MNLRATNENVDRQSRGSVLESPGQMVMRKYVYADESGNLDFSLKAGASRFFIVTTVMLEDHAIAAELSGLRRDLAWQGHKLPRGFHATEDSQAVRDAVFGVIQSHRFRVDSTIIEKRKSQPQWRTSELRFYQYTWLYHMRYITPRIVTSAQDEVLLVAATVGTKQKAASFNQAIEDVVRQSAPNTAMKSAYWPAYSDVCLQIADYCSWAIQRKWESGDDRSYRLIHSRIASEYNLFARGNWYYY